jgi:site-specific DNA-methyltransferase (adenine-specific)
MTSPRQDSFPKRIEELTEAGFKTAFYPFYWTYANGFPKAHSVAKALDKKEGRERKVVCRNPNSRENCTKDNTIFRSGTVGKTDYITVGDSPLEGSYAGSQPKPAVEVIVVAMKPLNERTYEAQAKANGHGITWMDDCRIPYDAEAPASQRGRFPATLLVSDNILDNGRKPGQGHWPKTKSTGFGKYGGGKSEYHGTGPKSTAENYSSYFSLDAWAERNLPFLIVPKPSKREKKLGLDGANPHCTIKPIQLMSYLITMGSRPGDVVLDCFLGSGTTGIAARRLGRRFIGIEIDPGYFQAAKKRMDAWMRQIA